MPNGNLLVYDNGDDRPVPPEDMFSRCIEYEIDHDQKTLTAVWQHKFDKFCSPTGSCRRMNNGNTLIG